jgi:hypothetical protein
MTDKLHIVRTISYLFCVLLLDSGLLLGCSSSGSSTATPTVTLPNSSSELSFKIQTNKKTLTQTVAQDGVSILFGTLGVYAYYYRPGKSGQMGTGSFDGYNTWSAANWSRWQMLGVNWEGGSDFLLTKDNDVNLRDRGAQRFYSDVTESYMSDEGVFAMDIIEVNGNFSLINNNNQVCGPGYLAVKSPSDFPALDFSSNCNGRTFRSAFDNSFLFAQRLWFARKDWFPVPIQIYRHSSLGSQTECYSSNVPLTAFQVEIIDDLMGNVEPHDFPPGLYRSSCGQPVVNGINIIPQEDSVAVIQFKKLKQHVLPTVTPNGHAIPTPAQTLFGQNMELTLSFNVLPDSFVNFASFNDSSASSDILIKRSDSGAVWGASIGFKIVTPAVLP